MLEILQKYYNAGLICGIEHDFLFLTTEKIEALKRELIVLKKFEVGKQLEISDVGLTINLGKEIKVMKSEKVGLSYFACSEKQKKGIILKEGTFLPIKQYSTINAIISLKDEIRSTIFMESIEMQYKQLGIEL